MRLAIVGRRATNREVYDYDFQIKFINTNNKASYDDRSTTSVTQQTATKEKGDSLKSHLLKEEEHLR